MFLIVASAIQIFLLLTIICLAVLHLRNERNGIVLAPACEPAGAQAQAQSEAV